MKIRQFSGSSLKLRTANIGVFQPLNLRYSTSIFSQSEAWARKANSHFAQQHDKLMVQFITLDKVR